MSLCDLLCFLRCKYDKFPTKVLKRALIDFYDSGSISNAKKQLLADIIKADFQDKVPTVPERRAGEMRTINEIDDIFTLIAFLDERKLLGYLPLYVSDNPDNMPPIRLYEGDLKGLMAMLDMMNEKITSQGVTIAAIVSELHSRMSGPGLAANTANVHRSTTSQGVINKAGNTLTTRTVSDIITGDPMHEIHHLTGECSKPSVARQSSGSWADRASAVSTPRHPHYPRDASSTATDEDQNDNNSYTVKQSRNYSRAAKRKVNNGYSPPEPVRLQQTQLQVKTQVSAQRNSHKAVYGRSTDGAIIVAANKLIKKAVFCIDNISVIGCVNDIVEHVRVQGIEVISCFEVKPRIRNSDNYTNNRKAFRLCINSDHRDKLLNSSSWPDSVVVSEWFFKEQQPSQVQQSTNPAKIVQAAPSEKRYRSGSPSSHHQLEQLDRDTVRLEREIVTNKPIELDSMDTTIIDDVLTGAEDLNSTILTQIPNEIVQCKSQSVDIVKIV